MRSAAHLKGHPIHPMLVAFPIAFLTGAFGFDVAYWLTGQGAFWTTGYYLALLGVLTAVVAAVPGLLDYLRVVPPRSSARNRATLHLVLNVGVLVLFGAALLVRGEPLPRLSTVLLLEAVGAALLAISGWLGGELAFKNQLGVENRYARAGRWRELTLERNVGGPTVVAAEGELEVGQMKLLRFRDRRLVLARTEDGFACFEDRCTHKGGSLAGGTLACGTVQCPWHGSQFDVRTGVVRAGPATEPVATFPVDVVAGEVQLRG